MSSNWWQTFFQLWLSGIASILTVIGATYALWEAVRNIWAKKFMAKPFDKLVTTHFAYQDVLAGVEKLVDIARGFQPEEIVGINRGGAIIGGMIGKDLGLVPRIVAVNPDNKTLSLDNIEKLGKHRILIVDDRLTDGEHMGIVYNFLRNTIHTDDVRKLVFVWIRKTNTVTTPDFWAYKASSEKLLFPWEPLGSSKHINFAYREMRRF